MDQTKLTIRVPHDLLKGAKRYASEHHTTLTRLISEYLRQLSVESDPLVDAPIVQRLSGSLPPDISVDDYYTYLDEKYGHQAQDSNRS